MSWLDEFPQRLAALDAGSLRRRRRAVVREPAARLRVEGQVLIDFCSNDYLGLAGDRRLRDAVHAATERYGVGAAASPMVSGYGPSEEALEHELAAALGMPRALTFASGYATNASVVPALVGPGDAIFPDALNHACLIDGARLSKASIARYPHADLGALDGLLAASPARRKLILTDAVFSMDGDVADLPALIALAERHDALLMIDDAHGFGVRGPQGRGSLRAVEPSGSGRVLYMATLGKALGVLGGFVAGPDALVEWLLQKTRSYTYATASPPLLAEALRAALRVVLSAEGDARRQHLQACATRLRERVLGSRHIQAAGWTLLPSATPIQALVVGDNEAALRLARRLQDLGFWVPAIRPPTVPPGSARLRIALSAAHDLRDVDALCDALDLGVPG